MLKNLTIKNRLIFLIGFLSVQLIVGGVIGIVSLANTNDAMKSLYDDRLVALGQLDKIVRLLNENQLILAKSLGDAPEEIGPHLDEVEANIGKAGELWQSYMASALTAEEKQVADKFAEQRKTFVEAGLMPAISALRTQDFAGARAALDGPMTELFVPVRAGIDKLIQLQLNVARSEFEKSQELYQLVRNSCTAGILFGIVLAWGVAAWIIRSIVKPLESAIDVADSVAAGDLSRKIAVESRDETGRLMQALQTMNQSLEQIVGQVRVGSDAIATASGQIAAGNLDLSARTEEQASSLQQTAASMEELTSTVKQNADNARQANQLAMSASEVAQRGGKAVSDVIATMGSINESSKKIVDIISVIDGIAFQTNILALNAAVEAARAGEQGRGFAVVASEVRSLAQRSAAAAREINTLISGSVERVDAGSRQVEQAGVTMNEIVESVRRVTDIMEEIASASREQTAGIEQISQAISQMDQVTQQNAALVEQAAAAAESMQTQAGALAHAVGVFKLDASQAGAAPMVLETDVATRKQRLNLTGNYENRVAALEQ